MSIISPCHQPNSIPSSSEFTYINLTAKWGKERIELYDLHPATTIAEIKEDLFEKTRILPSRQKLIGIGQNSDDMTLSEIKSKSCEVKLDPLYPTKKTMCHSFILMGTPEEKMLVEPTTIPEVVHDFDLDFNAGSDEWLAHVATGCNLKKFTDLTNISIMNEPRAGKPLLVLDLDHTLLDFSSKKLMQASSNEIGDLTAAQMKRPFMDEFLSIVYHHYDLVVWSQTSWRWLEIKLIELGMLTNSSYKFCFVLDKTSMFSITSSKKDGSKVKHYVKPLQIIWTKFQQWNEKNTIHLDDLSRNFALNLSNGLKVSPYHRKSSKQDVELLGLGKFLEMVALSNKSDFCQINFLKWVDVVSGKKRLEDICK